MVKEPAIAVNVAVVAPAMAVTDAGTETFALLELSAMDAPEDGTGLVKVTIQEDVPPEFSDAGLQLNAETWESVASVREAEAVPPFSEAVIWAEPSVVNDPAVAVKLAVVAAAAAKTDAGTETLALFEVSAIEAPELGAGWLRVTTHAEAPPGFSEDGVQLKAET